MSQFIFGEILLPNDAKKIHSNLVNNGSYPFALRSQLTRYDFYRRMAPPKSAVIPFVISDGPLDNTAELLLRKDSVIYEDPQVLEHYSNLISLSMVERVDLIVRLIREVLGQLGVSECILVLCDGTVNTDDFIYCDLNCLAENIKTQLESDMLFTVVNYWVTL